MTMTAPRDDLIRMVPMATSRTVIRADDTPGTLGRLEGYAAVFGVDTVIDSWEGKFIERIAPGAFGKSIKERGDKVKILFNHGFDPSIGDKPLGKPETIREDETGLWHSTPLDDTSYNRDLAASLRSGALDGQSFRFSVIRDEWEEPEGGLPIRTLRELRLYEMGVVTFPAYEATTAGVRAREAYAAWRTVHPANPQSDAASGTSAPHDAAVPDTASVVAPTQKERAQAIQRAKELART